MKQYAYTLPDGKVTPEISEYTDYTCRIYIRMLLHYFMLEVRYWKMLMYNSQIGTTPYYYEEISTDFMNLRLLILFLSF